MCVCVCVCVFVCRITSCSSLFSFLLFFYSVSLVVPHIKYAKETSIYLVAYTYIHTLISNGRHDMHAHTECCLGALLVPIKLSTKNINYYQRCTLTHVCVSVCVCVCVYECTFFLKYFFSYLSLSLFFPPSPCLHAPVCMFVDVCLYFRILASLPSFSQCVYVCMCVCVYVIYSGKEALSVSSWGQNPSERGNLGLFSISTKPKCDS